MSERIDLGRIKRRSVSDGCGAVYLIRAENGFYKIGSTTHPERRLAALKTGSPLKLEMTHLIVTWQWMHSKVEAYLHQRFTWQRREGEWFDLSDADVEWVENFQREMQKKGKASCELLATFE